MNTGNSVVKKNALICAIGKSLLIEGIISIVSVIAAYRIQSLLFGEEANRFPNAAKAALAIGIISILSAIICLVTGAAGKKSQAYLDEIARPADPTDPFADRLTRIGRLWLLLPLCIALGIQVPNIIHNTKTHNENVKKRWATVRELDEAFPGLRNTYGDKYIDAPEGAKVTALYSYRQREEGTAYSSQDFIISMDFEGNVSGIEYELYKEEGESAPTPEEMTDFVETVGEGLAKCSSDYRVFATPVPDRAVSRAQADAAKNDFASGYGEGRTMENGAACAYTSGSYYERYEVSVADMSIELAEYDDEEAARAETE